jgi:MFS family permease
MAKTFTALKIRNYRLFAIGSLVSNTGTWMQRVAQDWLVLVVTGSAGALGITTGLQFLPTLLFSAVAGVVADRFPRRNILVVTQIAMGIAAAALGVLALANSVQVWQIYVLTFLFGTASAFDVPARQAFVNEMVDPPNLVNAIGLNSASFNLARMAGPAVAGALITALGSGVTSTGWVIMLNALSYVGVLVAIMMIRTADLYPTKQLTSSKGQLRAGIQYVRARPDIMLVMAIVFCAGTFGLNFQMTTALMATDVYGKGAGEYGMFGSILAVGSLAGSLVAARRRASRQRLVVIAGIVFGLTVMLAGMMPTFVLFGAMLPLCGFAALTLVTAANTCVQLSAEPHMRGRVMALYMMIFMGGTPVGAPVLGWVAETWGARWTLIGGGALTTIGTTVAALTIGRLQGVRIAAEWESGPRLRLTTNDSPIAIR